ncbi:MAG: antibiotic biosynthesis monooxygenase [Fermentimonas sp.]|nr:antibiotic biosynthesis monooxygenase [Fermentimonas sp.]
MIVVTRNMKVAKDLTEKVLEDISHPSEVAKSEGFIRRDIIINKDAEDYVIIKVITYWDNKESLTKWHGSKEHQQGHIERHKQQKESGKEPVNRKALNLTIEEYDVVFTLMAE